MNGSSGLLRATAMVGIAIPLALGSCEPSCTPAPSAARIIEQRQLGTSVEGRAIIAYRVGTPGGVPVLAVGSIHGDEQAGIAIAEHLRGAAAIPAGFDVWVVPSINPDGNAAARRTNARGIDLNRNFPVRWQPINCAILPQNCSGTAPLTEPESRAFADFVLAIQPRLTVVYHGADRVVSAAMTAVARPATMTAYAATAGYPIASVPCSPSCTGTATQFVNGTITGASAFVVELATKAAGGLTPQGLAIHARAFFAAAAKTLLG